MIRTIGGTALAAVMFMLAATGPASAAINRKASVDASTRTFTWTGEPSPSVSAFFWYTEADPAGSCDAFVFGVNPGPTGPVTTQPQTVPPYTTPSTIGGQPVPVPPQTIPGGTVPGQTVGPVQRPGVYVPHSAIDYCDSTLVYVPQGKLVVALPDAGDAVPEDWDLFVYTSNSKGDFGQLVGSSKEAGAPESLTIPIATGWYIVNAVPFTSGNAGYTGSLTFTPTQDTQ